MGCTSAKPKRTTSIEDVAQKSKESLPLQTDKNGQINKPTPEKGPVKTKPTPVDANGSNDVSNAIQIPGAHRSFLAPDGIPFIDEDVESEVEERVVVQPVNDIHSKAQQPDQNKNVMVSVHKDVTPAPKKQQQQSVEVTSSSALPANSQMQPTGKKEVDLRVEPSQDGHRVTVQSVTVTKVITKVEPHTDVKSSDLKIAEEQAAATKIQAGIRGYLDRQKVKAIKAKKEQHPSVSMTVSKDDQHAQKGNIKLHREEHFDGDMDATASPPDHPKLDEGTAATKIQANYKGYKTRKMLRLKNKETN